MKEFMQPFMKRVMKIFAEVGEQEVSFGGDTVTFGGEDVIW